VRRALAAVLACVVLAGCSAEPDRSGSSARADTGGVDVDTPSLRAAKQDAGVEACAPGDAKAPGQDALPDVTLPCLGGGPDVALSSLRGPLVVNLFAQWCKPCRTELPYYQRLHEEGKGKVRVLGVDYLDAQPVRALQLVKQSGVTYPLLADPSGELRTKLKIRGLPGMVFVAADGTVSSVQFRLVRSYAELRDLVREELGVRL
jgi:thiol-disulfide isomerase/thioredoxin